MKEKLWILSFILLIITSLFLILEQDEIKNDKRDYNLAKAKEVLSNYFEDSYDIVNINDKYINALNNEKNIVIDLYTEEIIETSKLINENIESLANNLFLHKYSEHAINEIKNNISIYDIEKDGFVVKNGIYSVKLMCNLTDIKKIECDEKKSNEVNEPTIDKNKPAVALTFDDGPGKYTEEAAEILIDNKSNATFFMLGSNMERYPEIVKKLYESGFEIANHTYNHKSLTKLSETEIKRQLYLTNDIYKGITGTELILTRAPYGALNKNIIESTNTSFIGWSVDPRDWEVRDSQKVAENILNAVEDGDIILMHDIHYTSVRALDIILPELNKRGYQVVSVSELAYLKGEKIEINKKYVKFN